jgi:three-Cys-motif partner protein
MAGEGGFEPESVGAWSERKLAIVRDYAAAYSTILAAQERPAFHHMYIDGFAGAGVHTSRTTGELVSGSPLNALLVQPLFREYHLVELDPAKVQVLERIVGHRRDVRVYQGDCNQILPQTVFPLVEYAKYRRALCFLDPYGLHLDWQVVNAAGRIKTIDMFLNFPIHDMNRNVLLRDPAKVEARQTERMTAYWGDESWRELCYTHELDLFGKLEKESNERVVQAFRKRLHTTAGFKFASRPHAMKNSVGAVIYYLLFGSQKRTALEIAEDIFTRHPE